MSKMQPALQKLLDRNLSTDFQKRQRISKSQKRRRQKQSALNETVETATNASAAKRKRALTKMRNIAALENFDAEGGADDLDAIKARITALRSQRANRSKTDEQDSYSDEDEDPSQWEGLTPGLAPVGYEESSDDE